MHDGHSNVENDVAGVGVFEDLGVDLPRVQIQITLEKVIQTSVASDFKFGTHSKRSSLSLGLSNRLEDSVSVTLKVKSPLVQVACCESDVVAHDVWLLG